MTDSSIMGAASLWYRKTSKLTGAHIATIPVDLFLEENVKHEAVVASHNVQEGRDITTHIKHKLTTGSLKALVSNWSVKAPHISTGPQAGTTNTDAVAKKGNRALVFYNELLSLFRSNTLIEIVTSMGVFTNIMIVAIEVTRTGEQGEAQEFVIQFRQMNIVRLQKQTSTGITDAPDGTQPSTPTKKIGGVKGTGSTLRVPTPSETGGGSGGINQLGKPTRVPELM